MSLFRNLARRLRAGFGRKRESPDPLRWNDPLAARIEWTPLKRGGTNILIRRFAEPDFDRVEFRATWGARLFAGFFMVFGPGVSIFITKSEIAEGRSLGWESLFPLAIGLVFLGVGGGMLLRLATPVVFDKRGGFFWKGRTPPGEAPDRPAGKDSVALKEIHAVQLVSEWCRSGMASYTSYELNLVTKDGRRLNVVDQAGLGEIRKDAEALGRFLGCPVWDATGQA